MEIAKKPSRSYVKDQLEISWESIESYFQELANREINSSDALYKWLQDRSELSAVLEEEFAWRYIRMNVDTTNEDFQKDFGFFVKEINPKIAPFEDQLNRKLNDNPFKSELHEKGMDILLRGVKTSIDLFREENIPLFTQLEEESQKFGAITGQIEIKYKEKEYTLQQASKFLKGTDRKERKAVYDLICKERLAVKDQLNELYNKLISLRQEVAVNAGFENYRDYKFKAMGRFDYSVEDCLEFHQSVAKNFRPLSLKVDEIRKEKLGLDPLLPYDMAVDMDKKEPLQPFDGGEQLLSKTIECFDKLDPFFADCLREMDRRKHLDLESKKGKAPGGFNYPLYESGLPFIYMNAVGSFRDITTMVHEGGHAVHSVLSNHLPLVDYKSLPSEIAELASMSMELLSMDQWDVFFPNEEELKRAKRDQLLDIVNTLPWVATIDKFQHWVYTEKEHTVEDRYNNWLKIAGEFGSNAIDWSEYKEMEKNNWQRQLHLYEVPFYYIEYGFAQLGALAIWRNYRKDPKRTLEQYKEALSLGYTASIGEVYETAGIKFDFSNDYIKELADFLWEEIEKVV